MADEKEISEISKLLVELIKVIRVVSVYPEDNPLPIKLKESFSERFVDLIRDSGPFSFNIGQDKIYYQGEIVYEDRESDDSLAEIFFQAGITKITFSSSFQFDECNRFFKIIKAFINREPGAEDLVALFWQSEIPGLSYATLEDVFLDEYDGEFSIRTGDDEEDSFIRYGSGGDSDTGGLQYSAIFLSDAEAEEAASMGVGEVADAGSYPVQAGGIPSLSKGLSQIPQEMAEMQMGMAAVPSRGPARLPDTVQILNEAFSLSDSDMARIEEILKSDAQFDPFESTCRLIREMLWNQTEYSEFYEVVTVIEKTQTEFVQSGNLRAAISLFGYLEDINQALDNSRSRWKERIHDALITAGGKEKLNSLAEALNNHPEISQSDLRSYLNIFGWEALSAIVDLLGVLEFREHREAICDYLVDAGKEHVDIISRGVFDRRWFVVRNSVSVLARIGSTKAFTYLEKALGHEDPRVRLQIARGLKNNTDAMSMKMLKQLIWDSDEIVSEMAIQSLGNLNKEDGFKVIADLINDDRFATMSEANQERFIIAFSELGGEYAVSYLNTLISGWGLLQTQSHEFYQRLAFKALSRNRSEKAEATLLRLSRSWRRKIRQKAQQALRDRRQMIYGEK